MANSNNSRLGPIFAIRFQPNKDLLIVALSWLVVVGCVYIANNVVGTEPLGGMGYFFIYAVLGAALFGIGIPLYWMVVVRHRPVSDLGITRRHWVLSIGLQLIFATVLYWVSLRGTELPPMEELIPLVALTLAIGFFEAVFWRGWVQLRLEEAFGIIPAILLGSAIYALYHIGYGMGTNEIGFLFLIGIMFAVCFRLTKNILILIPLFQPMGQLVTLINDGLTLPFMSFMGFLMVLGLMLAMGFLAARYHRRHSHQDGTISKPTARPPAPTHSPVMP